MNRVRWAHLRGAEERSLIFNYQKTNDERYINELLGKYRKILLRFTNEMTSWKDPDQAEDLVQECMFRISKHIHSFDLASKFCTWAHIIMINLIRNHWRMAKRHNQRLVDLSEFDNIVSRSPLQDDVLHNELIFNLVIEAVQKLEPDKQEVFNLYFFHGYSIEEAAKILSVPPGTVKSRINRSRKSVYTLVGKRVLHDFVAERYNKKNNKTKSTF